MKGLIHSTESFGSVDGPGIRYIIFTQGCDMRCRYCHNPDTWSRASADAQEMSVADLLDKAERFRSYWGATQANGRTLGGITVSGGEPLLQIDFLTELFAEAHRRGISTCLDTAGQPYTSSSPFADKFDALMAHTDTVLFDVKHADPEEHRRLTGQPNANIIECLRRIDALGPEIWIRHVLVPRLTDSEENLTAIRAIADSLTHLRRLEVLPYHSMAHFKYEKLGIPYPLEDTPHPSPDEVRRAETLLNCRK